MDPGCDDGGGSGSGGSGTGSTGDPTPNIDSVTPNPVAAGAQTLTINGEYLGDYAGSLEFDGTCTQQPGSQPQWLTDTIYFGVVVDPTVAGYCSVAAVKSCPILVEGTSA